MQMKTQKIFFMNESNKRSLALLKLCILVVFDTDHSSKARLSVLSPTTTKMLKIQTQVNKLPTAPN